MSILVVGSVALDTIATPFGSCEDELGGSASYFSVAAGHFDKVQLVAVVGTDFPKKHIDFLGGRGIDVTGLQVAEGLTFRWQAEYGFELGGAKTISTCVNVFEHFHPVIPDQFKQSEYLFLANIDPCLQLEVLDKVNGAKFVACDTMNFWITRRREELLRTIERVNALILNDAEVRQLTGEPHLIKAAKWILDLGPKIVIIKKGEHGALLITPEFKFAAPAYPVESLYDPTGAGDSFAGGFVGFLARCGECCEDSLRLAVMYGTVMASFAVERFGVRRLAEIDTFAILERLKELKKLSDFQIEPV
ncbi:MAG: PfkB family carbohydrate kinase [Candidatus Eisenbacteria bacterium]|nr:PfkB family carbohydrate kinase [Candidatus Eisenbacteria bacterium]